MAKKIQQPSRKKAKGKHATTKDDAPSSDTIDASDVAALDKEMDAQQELNSDVANALMEINSFIEEHAEYFQSLEMDLPDLDTSQPVQRSYETESATVTMLISGLQDDKDGMMNASDDWQKGFVEAKAKITAFSKANNRRKSDQLANASFNFGELKQKITIAADRLCSLVLNFNVAQVWYDHVQGLLDDLKAIEPDDIKNLSGLDNPSSDDQDGVIPYVTPPTSTTLEIPVKPAVKKLKTGHHSDESLAVRNSAKLQAQLNSVKAGLIVIWKDKIEPAKVKYYEAREAARKYEVKHNPEGSALAKQTGTKRKKGADKAIPDQKQYQLTDLEYFDTNPFQDIKLTLEG
ncbi:hypothetical protein TWF696_007905 [Orbilia brochopaga]|uniref:Uncharacterized protein n=1 Tax=Orbilia brochopaga TaxID=3140254 RepID=A0AAV9UN09_9PEZI